MTNLPAILRQLASMIEADGGSPTAQAPVSAIVAAAGQTIRSESDEAKRARWRKSSALYRQRRKGIVSADASSTGALTVIAPSADAALTQGADASSGGKGGSAPFALDSCIFQPESTEDTDNPANARASTSASVSADGHPSSSSGQRRKHQRVSASSSSPGFARFWEAYPHTHRRADPKGCLAKWHREGCEAIADQIVEHVKASAESDQWRRGMEPKTGTYLNQRLWESPPPPKERTNVPNPNSADARREAKRAAEFEYTGELPVIRFGSGDARAG